MHALIIGNYGDKTCQCYLYKKRCFLPSSELNFSIDCLTESSQLPCEVTTIIVIPILKMPSLQLRGTCPGVPEKLWRQNLNPGLFSSTPIRLKHHAVLLEELDLLRISILPRHSHSEAQASSLLEEVQEEPLGSSPGFHYVHLASPHLTDEFGVKGIYQRSTAVRRREHDWAEGEVKTKLTDLSQPRGKLWSKYYPLECPQLMGVTGPYPHIPQEEHGLG